MGQVCSFTMKQKHLTISDRNNIQMGIEQTKTFHEIASAIEKDPSTISKEVRKHLFINESIIKINCDACPLLKKAPYVSNTCPKKRLDCGFKKQFYYAKRAALNSKSTYETFTFMYDKEVAQLLGISQIPVEDICQSPNLLAHKS